MKLKISKTSNSYYLDDDIIEWVAGEGDKKKRSASWYLNDLLRKLKNRKENSND